ncbi:MAG: T9SS type A sorting domain-containing protein [Bacteroidales bacterium]|nr:T9SS type A sorting domain-containing protein [Bacteroidales bacterium]
MALPYPSGENDHLKSGNLWVPVGPFGGDVTGLTLDPQNPENLFAAAGLPFISSDGGESWTVLSALAGISSNSISSFLALTDGTIFAIGPSMFGKVFRSTDGGSSWSTRTIPVNSNCTCLAADPGDPSTIYVGLVSNVSLTTNQVVVKSSDAGNSWISFDLTSVLPVGWNVVDIYVDPDDSQTIFAVANSGISDARIVASFDGGASWENRTSNLPYGIPYNAVAIGGQKVFVAGGQLFGSQYMGVYQSDNYGVSWVNISTGFPNKVSNDILINPSDINTMYVATEGDGIYYSNDGGTTWNYDATGAGDNGAARCLLMNPEDPDQLYAGFLSLALCKSLDAGLTWEYANEGIATLQVDDIEINPMDHQELLAGFEAENSGGCYLSQDGGETWNLVTGLPGTRFSQVTFGADEAMYAWSNGPSTVAQEGLYKSSDGGTSWINTGPNIGSLFETQIFALTASVSNPDRILIGGNNFGVNGWASVIYLSTNGGQDWVNTYIGPADNFYSIRFLFIDPSSDDETIYAGYKSEIQGGFLKSIDGGTTWAEIGTTIPVTYKWGGAIVCTPVDPAKILAGCGGYGNQGTVCISSDGGSTWSETNLSMGNYSQVTDMLIYPAFPEVVYCSSTQEGVQMSTDGGINWTPANDGLSASNITGFSNPYTEDSHWFCYASTINNSAFRTELYNPNVGFPGSLNEPEVTLFPNPSYGYVTFCIPEGEDIQRLDVVSVTGQSLFVRDIECAGLNSVDVQTELPPGIYLARIYFEENKVVMKKLIIQ